MWKQSPKKKSYQGPMAFSTYKGFKSDDKLIDKSDCHAWKMSLDLWKFYNGEPYCSYLLNFFYCIVKTQLFNISLVLNNKIKYVADFTINKSHIKMAQVITHRHCYFWTIVPRKTQLGKIGARNMRVSLLCRNSEYKCVIVIINQSPEEIWWE